jgi:hypothetical protein
MPVQQATELLSKQLIVRPSGGEGQAWMITQRTSDGIYHVRGQIVAREGSVVSIMSEIEPDRPTAESLGTAFFLLLERLARDSSRCSITAERSGVESGVGAGGTILSARIKCARYEGVLTLYQGSDEISKAPSIGILLHY